MNTDHLKFSIHIDLQLFGLITEKLLPTALGLKGLVYTTSATCNALHYTVTVVWEKLMWKYFRWWCDMTNIKHANYFLSMNK